MGERLVLGVDCGGTRTRAALASVERGLLGLGASGGGNPRDGGAARTARAIDDAVAGAFADAGLARVPVAAATVGAAGVATEEERGALRRALGPLALVGGGAPEIVHDLRVAQAGAFAGGPGMVLVAGTGSCCYGRASDGRESRAGGWGGRLDDGGSATWLGLEAVRAAVRASDGRGDRTVLSGRVLGVLGVEDLRAALRVVESEGYRAAVSRLAPAVTEAARDGDAVALEIVGRGARELAGMAEAVARALGPGAGPVVCLGGVFAAGEVVLGALDGELRARAPGCERRERRLPGVLGAVLMAADRLPGWAPDRRTGLIGALEGSWRGREAENL